MISLHKVSPKIVNLELLNSNSAHRNILEIILPSHYRMGASMKSDHIKMKTVQVKQMSARSKMTNTTRISVHVCLVGVLVLVSVLVPVINGLSSSAEAESNRGM